MTKIKNIFVKGVVDKDTDERLTSSEVMIDAENFLVTTSDGNNGGVGKNVPGNVKKTNYNIAGAKTIGTSKDESKEKVYNLIKGTTHDYVIEYDITTNTSETVLQDVTGGVLNFIDGERIRNVNIISTGEPDGDLLAWSGDSNPPRIVNIARAKTWGIGGFTEDQISVMKPAPVFAPTINNISSLEDNGVFLTERFISFGYRWKYSDGYYSAISTWSEYAFTPKGFEVDFDTFENLGMTNRFNKVRINFNTGLIDVIGIEVVFKESNSENIYIIEKLNKTEQGWGNNETRNILFSSSKINSVLSSDQFFRNFDNVPLSALCQTIIGNRIAYANFIEQRNLIDVSGDKVNVDLTLGFNSSPIGDAVVPSFYSPASITTVLGTTTFDDGLLNINFDNILFKLGGIITIKFFLRTVGGIVGRDPLYVDFDQDFSYELEDDYTNFADFYTNSNFKLELETTFSTVFNADALVLPPDGTVNTFNGFEVSNPSGNNVVIQSPYYIFDIDNGVDPVTQEGEFFNNQNTIVEYSVEGSNSSIHSNREYEICQIYLDNKGRKTTALVGGSNSIYVPPINSVTKNIFTVGVNHNPPAWATHYKFGIKQINKLYETIYTSVFYEEGVYRWFKLEGSNKQKVKENDTLIVKADRNGPLTSLVKVKVLEIKDQAKDFIEDNEDVTGTLIEEPSGLYMKIKPVGFSANYETDEFIQNVSSASTYNDRPTMYVDLFSEEDPSAPGTYIPYGLTPGDRVTLKFDSYRSGRSDGYYEKTFTVNGIYDNFKDWFDAELSTEAFTANTGEDYDPEIIEGTPIIFSGTITGVTLGSTNRFFLKVGGVHPGNGNNKKGYVGGSVSVRNVDGVIIFEKEYEDNINNSFFETPETFTIISNQHQFTTHILSKTFNCFCFGNGAESYQIKDVFNAKFLNIDFKPTAVAEDEYKEIHRFSDITYSGVFNANTNINKLNEFNLSLRNYKDDIEKVYGPIYKIKGQDTNLEVYQEDKCSIVFYGKDLLYNADGTTNLSRIEEVLGQQKTDGGEYGISQHPDSFDEFGFNSFFTDVKRGVVLKKNYNNGLFETSSQLMRSYFKKLFRNNTINHINGKYDQYNDFYILNIQYNDTEYVTWVYSDKDNGWLGRLKFNPEDMIRINNHFVSFKNGEIYLHNQEDIRNTFYGIESPSEFSFYFSQEPSTRKNFKNIEVEGSTAAEVELVTDLNKGYINQSDFEKKEGVFYAYVRNSNDEIDSSLLSCQGIGNCTISGLTLNFGFALDSIISVGDQVRNADLELVGTIVSKTANSLTLDAVENIVSGDFVLCSKPQSIANNDLLGYYMKVTCRFSSNTYQEIFAINSEVSKSFS
jgi:hypothetical protein